MQGMDYHRAKLLQAETTRHIMREFNTIKNNIIKSLEEHNKENVQPPRVEVVKNASSEKMMCC